MQNRLEANGARTSAWAYPCAIGLFSLALAARALLFAAGEGIPFITFFPAVFLAFYFCGTGAGWLTAVLSAACGYALYLPPYASLEPSAQKILASSAFLLGTGMYAWLSQRLRFTYGQLQQTARQVEEVNRALATSEEEFRDLFERAPCGYHSLGLDGTYSRINDTELEWLGCTREEVVGRLRPADFYTPEGRKQFEVNLRRFLETGSIKGATYDLVSRDGTVRRVSIDVSAVRDASGAIVASRSVMHDVTERERDRAKIQMLTQEQMAMLDNDLVGIARMRGTCGLWLNRAMHRIFGYDEGELIHASPRVLYPDTNAFCAAGDAARPRLARGETYRDQLEMVRKDGMRIWIDMYGVALDPAKGESLWMLADITALKRQEILLNTLASVDALTGVFTRRLMLDCLEQALARARREETQLALLYIDLDDFKPVNDRYGHACGDAVLRVVAKRMLDAIRRSDRLARVGGDEFVVILEGVKDAVGAHQAAEEIRRVCCQEIVLEDGRVIRVGASIGIGMYPDDAANVSELLSCADQAMYASKSSGGNCTMLFREASDLPRRQPKPELNETLPRTGIDQVDEQHRQLAQLVESLSAALVDPGRKAARDRIFTELVQATRTHFEDEERLMGEIHDPMLEAHRDFHRMLLLDIERLRRRVSESGDLSAMQEVRNWLIDHIGTADRAMGEHWLRFRVMPPPAAAEITGRAAAAQALQMEDSIAKQ